MYLLDVAKSIAKLPRRKEAFTMVDNTSSFCVVLLKVYQNEAYTYTRVNVSSDSSFINCAAAKSMSKYFVRFTSAVNCREVQNVNSTKSFYLGTVGGWSRSKLPLRNMNFEESNMPADSRRWNYSTWGSMNQPSFNSGAC